MEVLSLHLRVTEADLNALVERFGSAADHSIEDLRVALTPAGVKVTGAYPLFIRVKFETLWEPTVRDGRLHARLADMQAMGVPAAVFRSAVLKIFEDLAKDEPGVSFTNDTIVIDAEQALAAYLFPVALHLQDVRIEQGALILSAGPAKMGA